METIHDIRDLGLAILLIEHNMSWSWASASASPCSTSARPSPGPPAEVQNDGRHRGLPRRRVEPARGARGDSPAARVATWKSATARSRRSRHRLRVGKGEIVTLIGANGAGKTTTLRTISGLLAPRTGDVRSTARRSLERPHDDRARGISHVPEGRGIFPTSPCGQPRARRLPAQDRRHGRTGARVHALPAPQGAAQAGRPARSRAASSRCWPSPARSCRSPAAPPRRALPRTGPADGRDHLPRVRRINEEGDDDPPRRTERPHGARRSPTAATCWRPGTSRSKAVRRSSPTTPRSAARTSARRDFPGYPAAPVRS